ncbi:MAG TPA: hypothetical protein VFF06_16100 [Polyangia bacterium]|nr:hypothetical protein [Polyangia bacterium]
MDAGGLRALLAAELATRIPDVAGDSTVEATQLFVAKRRVCLEPFILDVNAQRAHVHVKAAIAARPQSTLEACVSGYGDTLEKQLADAARVWVHLAGAPILSLPAGRPLLDADHFDGSEPWGVPGAHGFVGPLRVMGPGAAALELAALARATAFTTGAPALGDSLLLLKATLFGEHARWRRTLEIHGHESARTDDDWDLGLPAPVEPVVCIRFAVAFK